MKVIIWGCGEIGKRIYKPLIDYHNVKILAYTDSSVNKQGGSIYNVPLIFPEQICKFEYDYVLIAVYAFETIENIREKLLKLNVPAEKIRAVALEREFMDTCMDQRMFWIKDFAEWRYEQKLDGCVAECGVFRGDSAKYINKFFPDRKLYLFDTFEGFKEKEIEYEIKLNNRSYNESIFTSKELFANTNIELLMRKMEYPSNIEIRKGFFPETAENVIASFVFVNLDMDLYLPMLAGLNFFWDKVVMGGCILLHDFFHPSLPGVRKAVDDFEKERKIYIHKTTIGDNCSIALIK